MVRTTSKLAYKQINEDNTIKSQSEYIYRIIKDVCEQDAYENLSLKEIKSLTNVDINAVSGRVNELKKEGRLIEDSKRKCNITGRLITPVRTLTMEELISQI